MADDLIRELISSRRIATLEEVETIITHVAGAPFATYMARVPKELRELLVGYGIQTPAKLPSIEWHLLKRIYDERQWPEGTTTSTYLGAVQK